MKTSFTSRYTIDGDDRSFDSTCINLNDDEYTFLQSEVEHEDYKQRPIVILPKGISWQHRKKIILKLIDEQILSQADVLLIRSDLKSIAKITEATIRYRNDVLSYRMLYAECDGYCEVEQRDIVREIQERITIEGGRFVIMEQEIKHPSDTGIETFLFATFQQSYEIIVDNLTNPHHPFPSMELPLAYDDQVDLPEKRKTSKKKVKEETKIRSQNKKTKKARTSTTEAAMTATTAPTVAAYSVVPDRATREGHTLSTGLSLASTMILDQSCTSIDSQYPSDRLTAMFGRLSMSQQN
jgi:hypothetical protein